MNVTNHELAALLRGLGEAMLESGETHRRLMHDSEPNQTLLMSMRRAGVRRERAEEIFMMASDLLADL